MTSPLRKKHQITAQPTKGTNHNCPKIENHEASERASCPSSIRERFAKLIDFARPIAGAILVVSTFTLSAPAAEMFGTDQPQQFTLVTQRAGSNETTTSSQLKWRPARSGSTISPTTNGTSYVVGQITPTNVAGNSMSNNGANFNQAANPAVIRTSANQLSDGNGPMISPAQLIEPSPAQPQQLRVARLQSQGGIEQPPAFPSQPMTSPFAVPSNSPEPMVPQRDSNPMPMQLPNNPSEPLPGPATDRDTYTPENTNRDVMSEDCETSKRLLKPRLDSALSYKILNLVPDIKGDTPYECKSSGSSFNPRAWGCITFTWKASALCHKPLYFEDWNMERYGHSWGPFLDPVVGTAHFFGTLPLLPYKMGVDPICECQYPLGYYRPGDCAPYMLEPFPISARGAAMEVGAVAGGIYLIP